MIELGGGEIRGPLHIVHCIIDLARISLATEIHNFGEWVDDAMDVWQDLDE